MSQKTYMYDTQWTALINAINGGDTSAIATALGQIKTSIDAIETALGSLSADVTQDSTQWSNLVNAITNQSITVDLSNITSDVVSNESTITPADTVTEALDLLKSDLNNKLTTDTSISTVSINRIKCMFCSYNMPINTTNIRYVVPVASLTNNELSNANNIISVVTHNTSTLNYVIVGTRVSGNNNIVFQLDSIPVQSDTLSLRCVVFYYV